MTQNHSAQSGLAMPTRYSRNFSNLRFAVFCLTSILVGIGFLSAEQPTGIVLNPTGVSTVSFVFNGANPGLWVKDTSSSLHTGDDLYAQDWSRSDGQTANQAVFAAISGTVAQSYDSETCYGRTVVIFDAASGFAVRYAHLADRTVLPGNPVVAGQTLIGHVGNSGPGGTKCSVTWMPYHLHIVTYKNATQATSRPISQIDLSDASGTFAAEFSFTDSRVNESSLIVAPNAIDVYYAQNSRIYHVVSYELAAAMESAGAPGWVWETRRQVDQTQFDQYTLGPEFITATANSNGLLVGDVSTDAVYVLQNGKRRWIRSSAAVMWLGTNWWPDVIEVPATVLSAYVPATGQDIWAVGEDSTGAVDQGMQDAYTRLMGTCGTTSSWKGWPGSFATCLEFPQSQVSAAAASGVSAITGKYQNFGNETTRYGALDSSARGTFGLWGAIFTKYQELGYSGSLLGFPTSDEIPYGDDRRSNFEGGYIHWTSSTNQTAVIYSTDPPPTVTINSPTTAETYTATSSPLSLGGTASDTAGVTSVTWTNDRGDSGTATGTTNWLASVPLQAGVNVITVTAIDTASQTGTDTLTVTYSASGPTTISCGTPVGSSLVADEQDEYVFDGAAGDVVWVSAVKTGGEALFSPLVGVYRPDSTLLATVSAGDAAALTLNQEGRYTLRVYDSGGDLGSYQLRLEWIAPWTKQCTSPVIACGNPVTGSLTENDQALRNFDGAPGDEVWVSAVKTGGEALFSPLVGVYRPDGTLLATVSAGDAAALTLNQAGRHTLRVYDSGGDLGSFQLRLEWIAPWTKQCTSQAIACGSPVTGSLTENDQALRTFDGAPGDEVWVSAVKTGGEALFYHWWGYTARTGRCWRRCRRAMRRR